MNQSPCHRSKLLLLGLLCAMTLTGCNSWGGRTTEPGIVPLRVWVVLGPGEQIGGFGNSGCRLSAIQIQSIVEDLQKSAWMFGSCRFTWNGALHTATNPDLIVSGPGRLNPVSAFLDWYVPDYSSPAAVNCYFTGWTQDNPNAGNVFGLCLDPRAAKPPYEPAIIINDGGADSLQGFQFGIQVIRDERLTLPHEMTHFLGRFEDECFGLEPVLRCYDPGEHTSANSVNILALCPSGCQRQRIVPHWPQKVWQFTEFRQIETRVASGLWNH